MVNRICLNIDVLLTIFFKDSREEIWQIEQGKEFHTVGADDEKDLFSRSVLVCIFLRKWLLDDDQRFLLGW